MTEQYEQEIRDRLENDEVLDVWERQFVLNNDNNEFTEDERVKAYEQ